MAVRRLLLLREERIFEKYVTVCNSDAVVAA
jgi:hypothetical protein